MAALPEFSKQCVIWFGEPLPSERDTLAAVGWHVRSADIESESGVGLRSNDTVLGVVDLRDNSIAGHDRIQRVATMNSHIPLLAIVPSEKKNGTSKRGGDTGAPRVLLDRCIDTFSLPSDLPRMVRTLRSLGKGDGDDRAHGDTDTDIEGMLGTSPVMRTIHAHIHKFAPVDLAVLITGQTGTGKEVAARALHALSPRRGKPFAAVNCGAIPANLVQSELFGHERGAFTGANTRRIGLFESAHGGSVLLDEVGDLPLDAQTNLLRVLQDGQLERVGSHCPVSIDVRILAATNVDLEKAVAEGRFRSDLYYRLNVLRLHVPRLAERGSDIPLLAEHFLGEFRQKHKPRARGFSAAARLAMQGFDWPGNVRELLNRVQRAAIIADSEQITPRDLELPECVRPGRGQPASDLERARGNADQEVLRTCLRESGFNVSEAARRLQVSRVTVYRLCKKYQLAVSEMR